MKSITGEENVEKVLSVNVKSDTVETVVSETPVITVDTTVSPISLDADTVDKILPEAPLPDTDNIISEVPIHPVDEAVVTIHNRQLSELTSDEIIVLIYSITFNPCNDVIKKSNITGELLSLVETFEELEEFNFPLKKVELKLLLNKIQEFKNIGVDPKYLNREV